MDLIEKEIQSINSNNNTLSILPKEFIKKENVVA